MIRYAEVPGRGAWQPLRWADLPEGLRWADLPDLPDDLAELEAELEERAEDAALELAILELSGEAA